MINPELIHTRELHNTLRRVLEEAENTQDHVGDNLAFQRAINRARDWNCRMIAAAELDLADDSEKNLLREKNDAGGEDHHSASSRRAPFRASARSPSTRKPKRVEPQRVKTRAATPSRSGGKSVAPERELTPEEKSKRIMDGWKSMPSEKEPPQPRRTAWT